MSNSTLSSFRALSVLLFFILFALGNSLARTTPLIVIILSVVLMASGTPAFIYGTITMDKYKDVFDYEPTQFWGKETNGKYVRGVLQVMNAVGLWSFVAGLALILMIMF